MSAVTSTTSPTADLGSAPRAATGRPHPLRSELSRLRHRRLVLLVVGLGFAALVAAMVIVFFTHSTDVAGARQKATVAAQQAAADQAQYRQECLADPSIPQADKDNGACGPEDSGPTAQDLYQDPRLRADVGLPAIAIGVAVGGALVAALVGATGVGADWSSRTIITLLTWEPRRIRLLGRRHLAIAIAVAAIGVVGQLVGLALGAVVVATRGTWDHLYGAASASVGYQPAPLIPAGHFWRDLVSLQVRGVVLMVVVAVLAAAVTTVTRHTGGTLGIAFAWFAVVENAVRIVFSQRGWPRWLVTENVVAFLSPGGQRMIAGSPASGSGSSMGPDDGGRTVLVSNLDALLYLGVLTAVALVLAGVLLRRRDL